MRAQDIIRAVLDMLDDDEQPQPQIAAVDTSEPISRFKQIMAMLDNPSDSPLSNAPNPATAPVSAVTTDVGGGPNAPKHPADIRIKDPRGYE